MGWRCFSVGAPLTSLSVKLLTGFDGHEYVFLTHGLSLYGGGTQEENQDKRGKRSNYFNSNKLRWFTFQLSCDLKGAGRICSLCADR